MSLPKFFKELQALAADHDFYLLKYPEEASRRPIRTKDNELCCPMALVCRKLSGYPDITNHDLNLFAKYLKINHAMVKRLVCAADYLGDEPELRAKLLAAVGLKESKK